MKMGNVLNTKNAVENLNLKQLSEDIRFKKKKESKKIKNQDIIDFRYWLINQMYPGSVPENSNTSFIAGERRVGQDPYERAVFDEVLMQFNNHFGTRGYDIG